MIHNILNKPNGVYSIRGEQVSIIVQENRVEIIARYILFVLLPRRSVSPFYFRAWKFAWFLLIGSIVFDDWKDAIFFEDEFSFENTRE